MNRKLPVAGPNTNYLDGHLTRSSFKELETKLRRIKMKKGDRVVIYHDPLTKCSKEGEAILVTFLREANFYRGEKYEEWEVRFKGDSHIVFRKFSEQDIIK